jgi:hypothetical protein
MHWINDYLTIKVNKLILIERNRYKLHNNTFVKKHTNSFINIFYLQFMKYNIGICIFIK